MIIQEVNYLKIKDYIEAAWTGDDGLEKFYDKSVKERSLNNFINDTYKKIVEFYRDGDEVKLYGLEIDRKPIGFLIISPQNNLLYSFGISKHYRSGDLLELVFNVIKDKLNGDFVCFLYSYNTRAINWLIKCGMVKLDYLIFNEIVQLKYN